MILCIFEINGLFRINLLGIQCGLDKSSPLNAPFVLWHSGLKSSKKLNLGKKLALSQRFFINFFFKNYYLFIKNTHPTIYIDLALAHTTFSIFGALWNKFLYVQSLILHSAQKCINCERLRKILKSNSLALLGTWYTPWKSKRIFASSVYKLHFCLNLE